MVHQMLDSSSIQCRTHFFETANQGEVNNSWSRKLRTRVKNLLQFFFISPDMIDLKMKIWSINAFMKQLDIGPRQPQLIDNIFLNLAGGSGGKGNRHGMPKNAANLLKSRIVGTKIMPPLTDAVGFIDGQQGYLLLSNRGKKSGFAKAFWRDIQQVVSSLGQIGIARFTLVAGKRRIDESRSNILPLQGIDLIFHQGNQWGNDDRETLTFCGQIESRNLVAKRFATPGGHDH